MSPLEIEVALHYFYSPNDHPDIDVPGYQQALANFLDNGMLVARDMAEDSQAEASKYKSTDRLRVYCEALKKVPLPVKKWVIPACKD